MTPEESLAYHRQKLREYRERVYADPVKYAEYRRKNNEDCRRSRAKRKSKEA